jgi:phospholipid/cholesterol/gamma-HCH transport system substrate-binding protein
MISRTTKTQLVAFALIAAIGMAFVGSRYAQLDRLFGADAYTVTADFAQSGGIFEGAEVTYRGTAVGRVGRLHLADNGVYVDLRIDKAQRRIPADTKAVVANRSAIGEQYVDLQPRSDGGPYLKDHSKIAQDDTQTPIEITEVLLNLDQLVESVGKDDLRTTVHELGTGFAGKGRDLQAILDNSSVLIRAADANVEQTIKLITDSKTVLGGQIAGADNIREWAKSTALLTDTLVKSDADLRKLIDQGDSAAQQVDALLTENKSDVAVLLSNLITTNEVAAVRMPNLEMLFLIYPVVSMGGYVVQSRDPSTHKYDARFGMVLGGSPPVCHNGYQGTNERAPQDTSNVPMNTNAGCTESPSTGSNVRGAQNVPRPGEGGGMNRTTVLTSYDPATRTVDGGPGVPEIRLGSTGGEQRVMGEDSWQWLMLGPLTK